MMVVQLKKFCQLFYSIDVGKNNKEREREEEGERKNKKIKKEYLNEVVKKIGLLILGEL